MTTENTPTLHEDLEPPEDTVVQTGDEDAPSATPGEHDNHLKAIYKKGRVNRELLTREDEEAMPDAALIAKMVSEAQDEGEFEHSTTDGIDLDGRPDRLAAEEEESTPDPDFVPNVVHEDVPEPEDVAPEPVAQVKPEPVQENNLDYEAVDGKVTVKIEGIEYTVPEADVKAAGGKAQYQSVRAANIRFQKAATYAKALQQEREELAQQRLAPTAEGGLPEKDDLSEEAELVQTYTNRLMDAAIDETEDDVTKLVEELVKLKRKTEQTEPKDSGSGKPKPVSVAAVEDYEAQWKLDRANANRMLIDEYSDVMLNKELKEIAHQKYVSLESDPRNLGRTAVEMAREAGDWVRRLTNSQPATHQRQAQELEARREKKRVLPKRSQARSTSTPLETKKPRSGRQYIQDLRRKQGNY